MKISTKLFLRLCIVFVLSLVFWFSPPAFAGDKDANQNGGDSSDNSGGNTDQNDTNKTKNCAFVDLSVKTFPIPTVDKNYKRQNCMGGSGK